MTNPLALKLKSFVTLSDADLARLDGLLSDVRTYEAKRDLIKEGDRPEVVFLMLEGWAYRYKIVTDGGRQIMAYLVPGDLCDPHIFILKEMDHSIGLLSDAKVAAIPKEAMIALTDESPQLARGLWWMTLVTKERCGNGSSTWGGATPTIASPTCLSNCGCASAPWD